MGRSRFYFAYGSNMNRERMLTRGMPVVSAQSGKLAQHTLLFNKRAATLQGVAYANIGHKIDSHVEGVLYELEDYAGIATMDPFEGAPRLYSREIFVINSVNGDIPAWTYVANRAMLADDVLPEADYVAHLLAGREFLSPDYWRAIQQQPLKT